jgi:hypothetical protein
VPDFSQNPALFLLAVVRWTGIAIAGLVGAGLLLTGAALNASLAAGDLAAYRAAQPCPPNVGSSRTCYQEQTLRLVSYDVRFGRSGGYLPTYTLRLAGGGSTYVATVGPVLIGTPRPGEAVPADIWRGRIVELKLGGKTLRTFAYPVAPPGWVPPLLVVLGLATLGVGALSVIRR